MDYLTESQLADRWHMSPRTLQGRRQQGKGPRYLKVGARVLYPLKEVEAYEAVNLHANTNGPLVHNNEPGGVDEAEAASIGDKKGTGCRTARRSRAGQPRPPPTASQPQALLAPANERPMTEELRKQRHCARLTSIAATPFHDEVSSHDDEIQRRSGAHE
jgi:hypothetical protein